jgi:hypothetical protein
MQNFDIEVEGHQISRELIITSIRQHMCSIGGQNFTVHVEEKSNSSPVQQLKAEIALIAEGLDMLHGDMKHSDIVDLSRKLKQTYETK